LFLIVLFVMPLIDLLEPYHSFGVVIGLFQSKCNALCRIL
jgi:hypothetical protein